MLKPPGYFAALVAVLRLIYLGANCNLLLFSNHARQRLMCRNDTVPLYGNLASLMIGNALPEEFTLAPRV